MSPDPRASRRSARRRATLSVEAIVDAAIGFLDREGAEKLTLRALAASLDSGVASLYWYASGKDELMAMVADEVLGRALAEDERLAAAGRSAPASFEGFPAPAPDPRTSPGTAEALGDLRRLSLCLFTQMLEHRWLAEQLIHAGPDEEHALRTWERTGRILQRMELSTAQQFHASLAVTNYASGMGAEISQRQSEEEDADVEQMFREQLERWGHTSTEQFPFVHSVLGEFHRHDDRTEYIAGLELLLGGIERQTWG
ncbi:TetR family transcriptional regulator [Kocuria sp. AG109]|nr:TetR family transcriptional regulator [Kocuria sp. AG109]